MHIFLTVNYSPWSKYSGGGQRSTHNIAKTMAQRGHKVTVIFSKPPWEEISVPDDLPYSIKWANLYAVQSKRNAFLRPLTSFSVNRVLDEIIEPNHPTIIHSNGDEAGLVHRLRSKHRFGFVCSPRYSNYPEVFFKHRTLPLSVKVITALKEGKYLRQGSAAFNADFCSPPSNWAAKIVGEAFNIPEERLRPVPNGIPSEFLNYHRKPFAKNGPLLFFGRLSKSKGVDILIESINILKKEALPEIKIIGQGELKNELIKKVHLFGLQDQVTFLPWMTHDELGLELSMASMCVLPSREENFSLAILSAMCIGTPTISTRVGGTPEIISDQNTGLLTVPDNTAELTKAIKRFLNNPSWREKMGKSGSEYVRNNLTWEHACSKFESIYDEALKKNNAHLSALRKV